MKSEDKEFDYILRNKLKLTPLIEINNIDYKKLKQDKIAKLELEKNNLIAINKDRNKQLKEILTNIENSNNTYYQLKEQFNQASRKKNKKSTKKTTLGIFKRAQSNKSQAENTNESILKNDKNAKK